MWLALQSSFLLTNTETKKKLLIEKKNDIKSKY